MKNEIFIGLYDNLGMNILLNKERKKGYGDGMKKIVRVCTTDEIVETIERSSKIKEDIDKIREQTHFIVESSVDSLRNWILDDADVKHLVVSMKEVFDTDAESIGITYHIEVEHPTTKFIYDFFIPDWLDNYQEYVESIIASKMTDEEEDSKDVNTEVTQVMTDEEEFVDQKVTYADTRKGESELRNTKSTSIIVEKEIRDRKLDYSDDEKDVGVSQEKSEKPQHYKIMTVVIDESNPDPATCCTYKDNAAGMASGKNATEWAEFFGYRPCLFKDGKVVGYLNPNNYNQFENGDPADITSGAAGDVMVEFPRRGVRISKSGDLITVSMTDNPDDPKFTYYAHSRGDSRRDYFYLGAYLGYIDDIKLRSLSAQLPTSEVSLDSFNAYANNDGSGYDVMHFYQWTYLQVMYLLQFKNLDSQSSVGMGYVKADSVSKTGNTNEKGMIYGTNSQTDHVKLFGIEDVWGNLYQIIDGFIVDNLYNYVITMDKYCNSPYRYENFGRYIFGENSGVITKFAGINKLGFVPAKMDPWSEPSDLRRDFGRVHAGSIPIVGGSRNIGSYSGMFHICCCWDFTTGAKYVGSRLCYY